MNHTAHCFLSFAQTDLLIGNFCGDYIKGSVWKSYPLGFQRGVKIHRTIDAYTDQHPISAESRAIMRPVAGRFSGPVVDLLYDYFLASGWTRFSEEDFDVFATRTYKALGQHQESMPPALALKVPIMLSDRFLHLYRTIEGTRKSMKLFGRRLPSHINTDKIVDHFIDHEAELGEQFSLFFPELHNHIYDIVTSFNKLHK